VLQVLYYNFWDVSVAHPIHKVLLYFFPLMLTQHGKAALPSKSNSNCFESNLRVSRSFVILSRLLISMSDAQLSIKKKMLGF
jgi:hypothetical protein